MIFCSFSVKYPFGKSLDLVLAGEVGIMKNEAIPIRTGFISTVQIGQSRIKGAVQVNSPLQNCQYYIDTWNSRKGTHSIRNNHRQPSYPSMPLIDKSPTAAKPTPMSTRSVSRTITKAVLSIEDILRDEDIQNHARRMGNYRFSKTRNVSVDSCAMREQDHVPLGRCTNKRCTK